jgi:hypothetical protein
LRSGVQHILCCVFILLFFVLCTLWCQFLWIFHFDNPNFLICIVLTFLSALHKHEIFDTINTVVSNHFHSVKISLFSFARSHDFDGMQRTGLPVSIYTTETPIDRCRFNVRYTISDYPFGIFKLFYIISYWKIKHPYGGVTGMLIQTNG